MAYNRKIYKLIIGLMLVLCIAFCAGCSKTIDNETVENKPVEIVDVIDDENAETSDEEISEPLAIVTTENRESIAVINEQGKIILEYDETGDIFPRGTFAENGLAVICDINRKYGFMNKKGEVVIEPQFDGTQGFATNGLAIVKSNGKIGCVNEKGEFVIDAEYDPLSSYFYNGLISLRLNGYYGVVDELGNTVVEHKFDYIGNFAKNGLAPAEIDNKYGYIDKKGQWVIEKQFDKAGDFADNGFACVKKGNKYGYIDESGEFIIEPQFDVAEKFFDNGLAAAGNEDKFGIIDETGAFLIKPQFDQVCQFFENGLILVLIGDGSLEYDNYFYVNKQGNVIFKNQSVVVANYYDDEKHYESMGLKIREDVVPIEIDGKWGYIDGMGNYVIEPMYDYISPYVSDSGLQSVRLGGKEGFINKDGEIVLEPIYEGVYPFN